MAMAPEITFPKYNPAITAATATRIPLSSVPMFVFIMLNF
jgi:hypothetical protein